jgi:Cys-tRNA(Pro)/Cys-tRNA(Cys) deacylase
MQTSLNVHNRLQELDIQHEIFKLSGHAANLEVAGAALGLDPHQIAMVELFRVDGEPVMAILPAGCRVDLEKLRAVAGGDRVERVPTEETTSLTGYPGNSVSPVGVKTEMTTFIDYYTLREDVVYTGSGEPTAILKIRSYDLVRATGGETVDLVEQPAEGQSE